ncbi:RNA polymerase sigma factor [Sphingomonas montanisoli]|uniref:Sigma-70 family RNA polymerase sigma factor n=1 Tax=Sphingomonas montanisoli TaxID=2606412 RepID=A0A5D9C7T4_9SPHN|nr:sigma-70 family RNA polymerase sigma factor [Sphingomonas montanisoli]TZG27130.1 sigma-70 family RNA polymerase sigma factor [Sphingomonas montanisoli]
MTDGGLEAILMLNRSALLRFLSLRSGGADPEDLLQELWLKVQSLEAGPIAEPRAYLFKMADNLVHDRRRADLRRNSRDDAWSGLGRGASPTASTQPTPEEALIARQQLRLVDEAIDALGERTALIFRSYRLEGMGQREIADKVGISLSAVEKHLQKAYRALTDMKDRLHADSLNPRRRGTEGHEDVAE